MKLLKLFGILVLVAAVGFGAFVVLRFAWRHWTVTLGALYLLGALVTLACGVYTVISVRASGTVHDRLFMMAAKVAETKVQTLTRLRMRASQVLLWSCTLLAWPALMTVALLRSYRAKGVLSMQAAAGHNQLGVDDLKGQPLFMLLATLFAVSSLTWSVQPPRHALAFCVVAVVYVCLLCLAVTVSPAPLAQRLRRGAANPFGSALLLALLTAAILVLAYAALQADGAPSSPDLLVAGRALYSQFESVEQFIGGKPVAPLTLAEGVSGALLASAVIQGLLSLKDFERRDEDYVVIAQLKLLLGRANEALDALKRVKDPSAASISAQAVAYLGVQQEQLAVDAWRKRQQMLATEALESETQSIFTLLQGAAMLPLPPAGFVTLLRRWLTLSPSEVSVSLLSGMLANMGRVPLAELLQVLEAPDLVDRYPVARLNLLLIDNRFDDAQALATALAPRDDGSEFVRALGVLMATVMSPTTTRQDDRQRFDEWCREMLPRLVDIAARLGDAEQLSMAIGPVTVLKKLAQEIDPSHVEAVRYLMSSVLQRLKATAPDPEAVNVAFEYLLDNPAGERA
ncbi:hypothetical protein [uncultured Methylibium sp.]|uniref:hypothetical protein n=1 Tax=uncultured Methylibium sp. TaxID=381093 RepID=UPI0025D1D3C4|nr:hypothetical protein [uncultured Methylibium sp.]